MSLLVVKTRRLIIKPFYPVDIDELLQIVGWLNDPTLMRYSEQRHMQHSVSSQISYVESIVFPSLYLGIHLNRNFIGTITAAVDEFNNIADVGILIGNRSCHNQGLGSEAWGAVLNHLFADMGIRKVEAGCMSNNMPMKKLFMKSKMHKEGARLDHFQFDKERTMDMEYWAKFSPNGYMQ